MPNVLLSVPHFEQSRDGFCLPACVRMVLAYLNQSLSEREIAQILATQPFGTPIANIERLSTWGYDVTLGSSSVSELQNYLVANIPVIARVWTVMLPHWQVDTSHVVVVVGFDDEFVYLNDPATTKAAEPILWNGFLAAWAEFDETAVIIQRSEL